MRKIVLILMFVASVAMAEGVHWAKDFKSGIKTATKESKPVLFIISQHHCKYCKILERTALSDARVIKALNRDFVAITSYEEDYVPRELYAQATPTIWFLSPKGQPMFQPIMGAIPTQSFLKALGVVKTAFDNYMAKKNKTKSETK